MGASGGHERKTQFVNGPSRTKLYQSDPFITVYTEYVMQIFTRVGPIVRNYASSYADLETCPETGVTDFGVSVARPFTRLGSR